jgi:hypothetical protein
MSLVKEKSICLNDGAYFLYFPELNTIIDIIIVNKQGIPENAIARYSRLPVVVYVSIIIDISEIKLPTVVIAADEAGR